MKVAIYCRLSDEDRDKLHEEDDSRSIQNQKSMLLQYCMEREWEVFNIYSDDDYVGSDRDRPAFNQLLRDAENGKFDIILCKTQSRFTREMELVEKYLHGLFPLWGVRFISIVDNADTDNKGNKKSRQINGLVNEWYLEDMSENIKAVLNNKRSNGHHIGTSSPYGYKKDPDNKGGLIIDEPAAEIVREVFRLYLQGYGKSKIAEILNSRGELNPTHYKIKMGWGEHMKHWNKSPLWSYQSIDIILHNETYIGTLIQGKYKKISYKSKKLVRTSKDQWYVIQDHHAPIIEDSVWEKAQELLSLKSKPRKLTGRINIFAGKCICKNCGYRLIMANDGEGRYYMRCDQKHHGRRNMCAGAHIPLIDLERIVLDEFRKLTLALLDEEYVSERVATNDDYQTQKNVLYGKIRKCESKIKELDTSLREAYVDKVKGVIHEEDYLLFASDFKEQKSVLQDDIAIHQERLDALNKRIEVVRSKKDLILPYMNAEKMDREMVDAFIDHITIGLRKGRKRTEEYPVEIHWKF